MITKTKLFYTFGNHMHWVDMQWLWGDQVLPQSIDDQLAFTRATGSPGNVNFDGIGYEKLSAESPATIKQLCDSITRGDADLVGGSYGQPYGLFQAAESNIRQFVFGIRAAIRCLGLRPRIFWEEEFYFFPQLPQVLRLAGFEGANLFFQWTWHTPIIPSEDASLISWQGIDSTTIPALPRNQLNVHQWPEDFEGLLDQDGPVDQIGNPAVVQWLELMPSPDWMCRSELLIPRMKELIDDPRFDVESLTCRDLIAEMLKSTPNPVVRCYKPDDVWHGMTLGKNADRQPRTARAVESKLLAAESMATIAGLAGRPYPSWDVYPSWELDEAWRHHLAAQHHDNHECEGLCGFVGYQQFRWANDAATEVLCRTLQTLALRLPGSPVCNTLGWEREILHTNEHGEKQLVTVSGYSVCDANQQPSRPHPHPSIMHGKERTTVLCDGLEWSVSKHTNLISSLRTHSREWLARPLADLCYRVDGKACSTTASASKNAVINDGGSADIPITLQMPKNSEASLRVTATHSPLANALDLHIGPFDDLPRPDPGFEGAMRLPIIPAFSIAEIRADGPLSAQAVQGSGPAQRKYPEGDWMTSPQWFETVTGSIVASSWINLIASDGTGLLVIHDGSQQAFRTNDGIEFVLNAYDPWDEQRYDLCGQRCRFRIIPHQGMTDAQCTRSARELLAEIVETELRTALDFADRDFILAVGGGGHPQDTPVASPVGGIKIENAPGVVMTALHREKLKLDENLKHTAGQRIQKKSNNACAFPWVIRLVEYDNEPCTAILTIPGTVNSAYKVGILGEIAVPQITDNRQLGELDCEIISNSQSATPQTRIRVPIQPREIVTIMLDVIEARKQWRNLDAKREVWATSHRVDDR